jgi:pimeloyl-ACP methyl ester carboxylesterase
MNMELPDFELPTAVASLPAGAIEYRLDRRGEAVVLVFHGGHVRAGLAMGEEVFASAGCTVLALSRPGYGRTPLSTGGSVVGYTDVVGVLCAELGIRRVAAVVGISGGGPTAATMAARHADLVERLIMVSAVGWLPYPDRRTRLGARVMFAPWSERGTWAAVHALSRVAPEVCLRLMMAGLSTRPAGAVLASLRPQDRAELLALFANMRSGRGFLNDLRSTPDITADIVQPTLVIATRTDRGVPFAHSRSLADTIRHAELAESRADSHCVWLGRDWPAIAERIRRFLNAGPTAAGSTGSVIPEGVGPCQPLGQASCDRFVGVSRLDADKHR